MQQDQEPAPDEPHPFELVEHLPSLVDDVPLLVARGRHLSLSFLLEIGAVPFHLRLDEGSVDAVERGPLLMRSWSFAIRGPEEGWSRFWRRYPPPHYHDLFALTKSGVFRIEGDLYPLMSNLLYFKALLAAPRLMGVAR
jgi:hypothetical protein